MGSSMKNKLVSVITPSFNCAESIGATIKSVQEQDYEHWEMLIVDDCSTDNTRAVVQAYADKDHRIKLITRKWNAGPAVSRNRGISHANGRYIAFLDADDMWYPQKLSKQLTFMGENEVALSYTAYRRVDESGRELGFIIPPEKLTYEELLKSCRIGCLTALYDTKRLNGKVYMPNIARRQDFALWLKIMRQIGDAHGLTEVLADYTVAANSVSSNKITAAKYQWRVYREVEKLTFTESVYYFANYAYHAIRNRI